MILSNKARFINDILTDTIDLRKKKIEEVNSILKQMKYDTILHEHAHAQDSEAEEDQSSSYKYLTKMPMDMVTEENFKKLIKERDLKTSKSKLLESTPESTIWLNELDDFKTQYQTYKRERSKADDSSSKKQEAGTKKKTKLVKKMMVV
jgi:uncharacterized membrane protein YjjP (DUF1212 family)